MADDDFPTTFKPFTENDSDLKPRKRRRREIEPLFIEPEPVAAAPARRLRRQPAVDFWASREGARDRRGRRG